MSLDMITDWRDEGELKPENVVKSEKPIQEIRREIASWPEKRKIDYAHRLAAQTHCKGKGRASEEKLTTIISRLVKLQRSADNYREMLDLKREKEKDD